MTVGGARENDLARELSSLLERISDPNAALLSTDLLRAQYLAGMLNVDMKSGLKLSQNTSQQMESILRKQG